MYIRYNYLHSKVNCNYFLHYHGTVNIISKIINNRSNEDEEIENLW